MFIGGALGALLRRPGTTVAAGVVSHHLADCVIHTVPGTFREENCDTPSYNVTETAFAVLDLAGGLALLLAATRRHPQRLPIVMGAIAGITPDLIDNAPGIAPRFRATRFGRRYHQMHHHLHRTARPHEWRLGLATQIVAILIGAAVLRR